MIESAIMINKLQLQLTMVFCQNLWLPWYIILRETLLKINGNIFLNTEISQLMTIFIVFTHTNNC